LPPSNPPSRPQNGGQIQSGVELAKAAKGESVFGVAAIIFVFILGWLVLLGCVPFLREARQWRNQPAAPPKLALAAAARPSDKSDASTVFDVQGKLVARKRG
jgi:hypothetical protein